LVPFGPKLGALLAEHLRQRETASTSPAQDESPLFCLRGGRAINPCTISQTFHALIPKLRLEIPLGIPDPHLHDLRHYSESRIIPHTDLRGLQSLENMRAGGRANTE
jgi:hypothetical protein